TLTSGELTSKGDVTITGPGAGKLIVSGNGASRVFHIDDDLSGSTDSPAAITGLSIVSGNVSGSGFAGGCGGILSAESLGLTGVVLSGNQADAGGGLFDVFGKSVTISKSQVLGNTATESGGGLEIVSIKQALKISKSIVSGNTAGSNGGGVFAGLPST